VPDDPSRQRSAADFGSASAWRREFVETAQSLAGGSGWVLLTYSRRQKRFWNQIATDHTQAAVDAAPVLVLDMYEHAYQMDFGVNATAYIDTFFRNINWEAVLEADRDRAKRSAAAERRPVVDDGHAVASRSRSLAAQLANGSGVQIVDVRAAGPHVAARGSDGGARRGVIRIASRSGSPS